MWALVSVWQSKPTPTPPTLLFLPGPVSGGCSANPWALGLWSRLPDTSSPPRKSAPHPEISLGRSSQGKHRVPGGGLAFPARPRDSEPLPGVLGQPLRSQVSDFQTYPKVSSLCPKILGLSLVPPEGFCPVDHVALRGKAPHSPFQSPAFPLRPPRCSLPCPEAWENTASRYLVDGFGVSWGPEVSLAV